MVQGKICSDSSAPHINKSFCFLLPEGPPLSNTTFPHIVPLITLLERDAAVPENPEPWENLDNGVEVVMAHLEAARMVAHHGGLYHTNAEMKLQGKEGHVEQSSAKSMLGRQSSVCPVACSALPKLACSLQAS